MSSSLSQQQINDIYLSLFGTGITPSASDYASLESLSVNAAISAIINSADTAQYDYPIIRIIEFVSGVAPDPLQLATWANYLETGGSLTSVVAAFAGGTVFQNVFNGGHPVNVNAPPTFAIMYNIIQHALSTNAAQNNYLPTIPQVDGWLATGLSTAQILAQFANGDQYTALTQPYIQNYLAQVAVVAVNSAGGAIGGVTPPVGSLFGVSGPPITITDSTAPTKSTTAGNTITFTVTEVGLPAGTQDMWALTGTAVTGGEVTSPTSGTITFNALGTATVTVTTDYTNLSSASLTLGLTSAPAVTPDTVTLNAPAIQNFTAVVGETLLGGPENTIFQGAVDDLTVGQNTYTSVLDSAVGTAGFNNTLSLVIFNDKHAVDIIPNATNVQTFQVTDLNGESSDTAFNMQMMPQLTTINLVASDQNQDVFFNIPNVVNLGIINNDYAGTDSVELFVQNSVATAPGPHPVTITLQNAGDVAIEYQDTSSGPYDYSADFVTAFNFQNSGDNHVDLWGASTAQSISVAGTGSLWLDFEGKASGYCFHDENLYALTSVNAGFLSGAYDTTEYQFGFNDANIFNPLTFFGAQGNTFVDLNLEVQSTDTGTARGGTFAITTFGGNDKIKIDSYKGNGETITVNSGGGDTTNTNTGSGRGGDSIDLNGWMAVNQTLSVTSGDGNNNVNVVSADYANVTVNQGNGNNNIDIDIWNNQITTLPTLDEGSSAQVTVNVGDGNNGIFINTNKLGGDDNDELSHVTVGAGNGSNEIVVRMGSDSTSMVTVGNGNGNSIDVQTQGSDDGTTFPTTSTITVGTGGTSTDENVITYNDNNAVTSAGGGNGGYETVTVNAGLGGGGVGDISITIGTHSTANVNVGDGQYDITIDMEGSHDTRQRRRPGNGNNDIHVTDSRAEQRSRPASHLGDGINDILVVFDETSRPT